MVTIMRWTGREARLLRETALRMSIRDFASLTNLSTYAIRDFEAKGEHARLRVSTQRILDETLAGAPDDARRRFAAALAPAGHVGPTGLTFTPRESSEEVEHSNRRPASGTALAPADTDGPERLLLGQLPAPDATFVDHFAALRALLVDSDNRLGAASVLPAVRLHLCVIAQLRRQARGQLHDQLLGAEARWAEFAGWLSDDLGDRSAGTWWLGQAMSMAQEVSDADLSAYLLARMAQRSAWGADGDRVLGLARAGARAGAIHAHVRAFVTLQEAHGYAAAGETYLFESSVAHAQTLIEDQHAQGGDLGDFCTVPYVLAQTGEGWLRLNRPDSAAECFSRALDSWPETYQRDRGVYMSRAALAQLDSGEPEQAAATALEALRVADVTGSARVRREVVELSRRLAGLSHLPAAGQLVAALEAHEAGPS